LDARQDQCTEILDGLSMVLSYHVMAKVEGMIIWGEQELPSGKGILDEGLTDSEGIIRKIQDGIAGTTLREQRTIQIENLPKYVILGVSA